VDETRVRQHGRKVELIDIESIKVFENPRLHPEREIQELMESIKVYGFTQPVLLSKSDSTLVAGYARLEAYKRLGEKQIPSILLDIEPREYSAYAIIDNRIAEFASWDYALLIKRIEEMEQEGGAIVIAYNPEEIEDLKRWQQESVASVDIEDLIDKKGGLPQETGAEYVELVLVVPISAWQKERRNIESDVSNLIMKYEGMRFISPRIKVERSKKK
jgi:hypothetical protein